MKKRMIAGLSGSLLIAIAAAPVAIAQDIAVTGTRERVVGRNFHGAPIIERSASVRVTLGDLDLATAPGWTMMENRISSGSRLACTAVESIIANDMQDDRATCSRRTYGAAIAKVRQLTRTTPRLAALNIGVGGPMR